MRDRVFSTNRGSRPHDPTGFLIQVGIPAGAVLYFVLSQLYDWAYSETVLGYLVIVSLFGNFTLWILNRTHSSSSSQYDGDLVVEQKEDRLVYSLSLNKDPEVFANQNQVVFKVKSSEPDSVKVPIGKDLLA